MSEEMNDLAMKAQSGNRKALLQLWQGVSRLSYKIAMRYKRIADLNGAVDTDDLKQCAFLGFYEAVQGFDPLQGSFPSVLSYGVRSACRRTLGLTGRERREHYTTISLDAPIPGADDLTIADTIQDPASADAFEQTELRQDIEKALHRLPDDMRSIIRLHDLEGLGLDEASAKVGHATNAGRKLRRKGFHKLRQDKCIRDHGPSVRLIYKGFRAWDRDWTSVVEEEAFRRISLGY